MTYSVVISSLSCKLPAKKFDNLVADGFVDGNCNVRYFVLEDKTRVEVATAGVMFEFDKARQEIVEAQQALQQPAQG